MFARPLFAFQLAVNLVASLAFSILQIPEAHASRSVPGVCEQRSNPVLDPSKFTDLLNASKVILAESPRGNGVAKFCEETTKFGQFRHFTGVKNGETRSFRSDEEMTKAMTKSLTIEADEKWLGSIYPDQAVRERNFNQVALYEFRGMGMVGTNEIRKFLADPNSIPRGHTFDQVKASWDEIDQSTGMSTKAYAEAQRAIPVICAFYGLRTAIDCNTSLKEISHLMQPKRHLTAIPIIKAVLGDPRYQAGAAIAAIKIIDKIQSNEPVTGNFFDDVHESYLKAGLNAHDAEEFTWNLIAVYASRGPNIGLLSEFSTDKNFKTLVALQTIAAAINVLDSRTIRSGHPYSYPKNVTTTCDFGKPYHFWMSAFLSRRMAKLTGNPEAAATAAYLADVGYQMRKEGDDRDPKRAFMSPSYGPANNKMRIDLGFSAAGAAFGAQVFKNKGFRPLLVDQGIQTLMKNGTIKSTLSESEAQKKWTDLGGLGGFFRWSDIFAPQSALDFYLSK